MPKREKEGNIDETKKEDNKVLGVTINMNIYIYVSDLMSQ